MACPGLQLHYSNLCPCCHMAFYPMPVFVSPLLLIRTTVILDLGPTLWKTLGLHSAALKAESSRLDFYLCQGRVPERTKTSPKVAHGPTADGGLDLKPPASQPTLSHHPSCTGAPCSGPRISRVIGDKDGSGRWY